MTDKHTLKSDLPSRLPVHLSPPAQEPLLDLGPDRNPRSMGLVRSWMENDQWMYADHAKLAEDAASQYNLYLDRSERLIPDWVFDQAREVKMSEEEVWSVKDRDGNWVACGVSEARARRIFNLLPSSFYLYKGDYDRPLTLIASHQPRITKIKVVRWTDLKHHELFEGPFDSPSFGDAEYTLVRASQLISELESENERYENLEGCSLRPLITELHRVTSAGVLVALNG